MTDFKNSKVTEPMNAIDVLSAACFIVVFFVLPAFILSAQS